jgi:thymidylate synthase (FAD)
MEHKIIENVLGDSIGFVSLVDKMETDPAVKVVNAARASFGKMSDVFLEKDKKLANFLWKETHTSPYRHSYFTFMLKMPLFIAKQAWKYQVGSAWREYKDEAGNTLSTEQFAEMADIIISGDWNEFSGRYATFKPEFYVPSEMRKVDPVNKQSSIPDPNLNVFIETMRKANETQFAIYNELITNGVAREIARTILPVSTYTTAYWTVSLQGVLWFLKQRRKWDAQYEIRQYANAIYDLVEPHIDQLELALQSVE